MAVEKDLKVELRKHLQVLFDPQTGDLKSEYAEEVNECPVCGSRASKLYCNKDGFIHKRCLNCSMVYINPRLTLDATHNFYNSVVNEVYNDEKFHDDTEGSLGSFDDKLNIDNKIILNVLLIAT